jgi:hypothetical protein
LRFSLSDQLAVEAMLREVGFARTEMVHFYWGHQVVFHAFP